MFYTGMAGIRNVPMRSSLEGMRKDIITERAVEKRGNSEEEQQESREHQGQKERKEKQEDSYYTTGDMKDLVEAETISDVQELRNDLHDRELAISNSDMEEAKKKISLQHLQNMQERCELKIKKLCFEISLTKRIAEAEKKREVEKAAKLREEYAREKNLRKTGEYSELQRILTAQENTKDRKAYMLYDMMQNGTDLLREMHQVGNYIDVKSVD